MVTSWDANTSVESIFDTVKAVIDGAAIPEKKEQEPASTEKRDSGDSGSREEL